MVDFVSTVAGGFVITMTWKFIATAVISIGFSSFLAAASFAATDLVLLNRSLFPERPWTPLTGADGALVGTGRATDPASSWSRNPSLLAHGGDWHVRATGLGLDAQRNDIRADATDYTDTSPFISVGETGFRNTHGHLAFGLYVAQDAYQQSKAAYITPVPGFGPVSLENQSTTSRARFGLAAATAREPWSFGAALEINRSHEDLQFLPSEDAQNLGAVPARSNLHGTSLGGALGATWQAHPIVLVGADAHFAGSPDLKDDDGNAVGSDEFPVAFDVGAFVGKPEGGHLLVGASYEGERSVALGDSVGRGVDVDPARWHLGAGYYYKPKEVAWEFRAGFNWSPHPADGGSRYTLTGIGLGYDFDGVLARLSYSRDARHAPDNTNTTRNWFTLGLDLKL